MQESEGLGLPRGRVLNGLRVLRADSIRLHEDGDDVEAFRRLGAAARITLTFARQADEFHSALGLGSGSSVLRECMVIVRDGLREPPDHLDVDALVALADHLEANVSIDAPALFEAIRLVKEGLEPYARPS